MFDWVLHNNKICKIQFSGQKYSSKGPLKGGQSRIYWNVKVPNVGTLNLCLEMPDSLKNVWAQSQILSYLILSSLILSYLILSYLILLWGCYRRTHCHCQIWQSVIIEALYELTKLVIIGVTWKLRQTLKNKNVRSPTCHPLPQFPRNYSRPFKKLILSVYHCQGNIKVRSRQGQGQGEVQARHKQSQGKVERQGQGKINVRLRQSNHNHIHNYN